MATPSIVIVQRFTYRDKDEEFSNRYHMTGDDPADTAAWKTLADGLISQLQPIYDGSVGFVRAYGYHEDGHPSVAQIDYEAPGNTVVFGTTTYTTTAMPGDDAMMVQWDTGRLSTRNKRIYLRKYFHGVFNRVADKDKINATQEANLNTLATGLMADLGDGTHLLAGPDGNSPINGGASQWITTRTLKRRGKRPPS